MAKVLRIVGLVLLALVLILVLAAAIYLPRAEQASFPQTDGEIHLHGLNGPVDVYRDQNGIPNIYASSEHDLFFAEGYVHAQDRFWQMDFQRHTSAGRLSELLGSNTLDVDTFLRTMGWERVAKQELANMDTQSEAMLKSYADGVNAYLADHSGTQISLEYLFLKLLNSNYSPAPWEPLNSVSWAKAMAWDLKANMDTEIERALLLKNLPADQIAQLFPDYPADAPIIVPNYSVAASGSKSQPNSASTQMPQELIALFDTVGKRNSELNNLLGADPGAGLGSNSWVVSGKLSATGAPLLANDPHLAASIPSIWYQIGLHCQPKGPDCDYDAAGVSFVGVPGIVIGHNDRIAWGFTNVGPDVMDLYIIKVNPDNPNQYEMNGSWVDMDVVTEDIVVAGGDTVHLPVRITQFGPIISDSYGALKDFGKNAGVEVPENYAIALKWTALEPGNTFQSLFEMNRAQNFDEFRAAASQFVVPAQNLLYADVDGNIGYQMPGYIPIRGTGDGRYPAPGWTNEYAWQGYIPFDQLPYSYNPASGYIVAANNAVVGANYPYQISDTWDYGFRAKRIVDLIESAPGPIGIAYFEKMQGDDLNLGALQITPALTSLDMGDTHLNDLRDMLTNWDGQQTSDSAGAALFNVFWKHLLADTFQDEMPKDYWPSGGSSWYVTVANLLADPQNAWWDNVNTPAVETRDDILVKAFAEGVTEIEKTLGKNSAKWTWGGLHTITFEHAVMSNFPLIDKLFNRGPFAVSGGNAIVNATNWDADTGSFATQSLPSKRTIMDLGNWENSLQITITGESGHAYNPHYIDMAALWASIQYLPMHWDLTAIEAAAEGHLILLP